MIEIERKYLFKGEDPFKLPYTYKYEISDTYLNDYIRIRNFNNEDRCVITNKGDGTISREEIELEILTKIKLREDLFPTIEKTRLIVPYKSHNFEVNIFKNIAYKNKQLIIVEVELKSEKEEFEKPEWLGVEITEDTRFYAKNLTRIKLMKDFSIMIKGG